MPARKVLEKKSSNNTKEAESRRERVITSERFKTFFLFLLYSAVFLSILPINVLLGGWVRGFAFTVVVITIYVILFEVSTVEHGWALSIPEEIFAEFSPKEKALLMVRPLLFSVLLRVFLIGSLEFVILLCFTPVLAAYSIVNVNSFVKEVLSVTGSVTAVSGILTAVFKYFEQSKRDLGRVIDSIAAQIVMQISDVLSFGKFSKFVQDLQRIPKKGDCAKKLRPYIVMVENPMLDGQVILQKYLKEMKRDPKKALRELWRRTILDKGFQGYIELEEKIKTGAGEEEKEELLNCLDKLYDLFINSDDVTKTLERIKNEVETLEKPLEKPIKKALLESLWIIPPLFYAEEPFIYYSLLEELSEKKLLLYTHLKKKLEEYFPSLFKFVKHPL